MADRAEERPRSSSGARAELGLLRLLSEQHAVERQRDLAAHRRQELLLREVTQADGVPGVTPRTPIVRPDRRSGT